MTFSNSIWLKMIKWDKIAEDLNSFWNLLKIYELQFT